MMSRAWLLALLVVTGCAMNQPRVREVSVRSRTRTVELPDQRVFLGDRASGYRSQSQALPAGEQSREVLVQWTGDAVTQVKLEYRQGGLALEQAIPVTYGSAHVFTVPAAASLTAWRVTLWGGAELLAERKSALW